jgi:hypothetical protein
VVLLIVLSLNQALAARPQDQQQSLEYAKRCYPLAAQLIKTKFEKTSANPGNRVVFKTVAFRNYFLRNESYQEVRLTVDFEITTLIKIKTSGKYFTESVSESFGRGLFYFYKNSCKFSRAIEYTQSN